jgi:hypothetical protein
VRWLLEASNDRRTWTVVDVFPDEADVMEAIANTRALWFQITPVSTSRARMEHLRMQLGGTA